MTAPGSSLFRQANHRGSPHVLRRLSTPANSLPRGPAGRPRAGSPGRIARARAKLREVERLAEHLVEGGLLILSEDFADPIQRGSSYLLSHLVDDGFHLLRMARGQLFELFGDGRLRDRQQALAVLELNLPMMTAA